MKDTKKNETSENRTPVKRFFSSVGDNLTTLMGVNFLYAVFNIPMMLVAFAIVLILLPMANPVFVPDNFSAFMADAGVIAAEGTDGLNRFYYMLMALCAMILMGTGLICLGPLQVGFSQVYRNIYRGGEVSLWGDFKEGVSKNWKQGLGAGFVSLIVTTVILGGLAYYSSGEGTVATIVSTLFAVLFFVFIAVQNIVYQQIVSIDLPLSKVYKNAYLFFMLRFGPFIGITGILVLTLMVIPFALIVTTTIFGYAFAVLLFLFVVIWLCQYMYAFVTGELINQYVANPAPAGEESSDEDSDDQDESNDDSDDNEEDEDDGQSDAEGSEDDSEDNEADADTEEEGCEDPGE